MKFTRPRVSSYEPEGETAVADPLYTSEILAVVLCKYTASLVSIDERDVPCEARGLRHVDEECRTVFWSADALVRGDVTSEMASGIVRGGEGMEPLFEHPV